ncbi:hypothetical protein AVEN_232882-1 [Araneus ventricosus]|uniref:Uncharacterized protein n=1 Tax=Araneus ventricosus TaxID=182803 RepID=A0A4Y2X116_ARAVE|nr:hypothetical protein AVEN_232882-1 [Araneus ventricosus]
MGTWKESSTAPKSGRGDFQGTSRELMRLAPNLLQGESIGREINLCLPTAALCNMAPFPERILTSQVRSVLPEDDAKIHITESITVKPSKHQETPSIVEDSVVGAVKPNK